MDEGKLQKLKRAELQRLAKINGIKANKKNADIVSELLKIQKKEEIHRVDPCPKVSDISKDEDNKEFSQFNVLDADMKDEISFNESDIPKDTGLNMAVSTTLDTKHADTMVVKEAKHDPKKTQIPKLLNNSARKRKINWESIHKNCFGKMESIDDYIQKKQQRRNQLKFSFKSAAQDAQSVLSQMNRTHNTPITLKPATGIRSRVTEMKMAAKNTPIKSKENIAASTRATKTPSTDTRKCLSRPQNSLTPCKRLSTRSSCIRKSIGKTDNIKRTKSKDLDRSLHSSKIPFNRTSCFDLRSPNWKPSTNLNTTNPSSAKKFDLKESLKKRLPYKPYAGKLKCLEDKYAKKEDLVEKRRVNLKTIRTAQTRDDRRIATNQNRRNTKQNALNKRRGIVE